MYIGSRIERNNYVRLLNNKEVSYTRTKSIIEYQCDRCNCRFDRQQNGKDIGQHRLMHFCKKCVDRSHNSTLVHKRKDVVRPAGSLGELRSRNNTKYLEVWTGKDSWHQKSHKNNGWIRQHIFVMQDHLGYIIPTGYVVHHIDGNKKNNKIDNLVLLTVQEHNNAHAKSESIVFELINRGLVSFNRNTKLYELL